MGFHGIVCYSAFALDTCYLLMLVLMCCGRRAYSPIILHTDGIARLCLLLPRSERVQEPMVPNCKKIGRPSLSEHKMRDTKLRDSLAAVVAKLDGEAKDDYRVASTAYSLFSCSCGRKSTTPRHAEA